MKAKPKLSEIIMHGILLLCGLLAVGFLVIITIYLILSGLPAIGKIGIHNFLFGTEWTPTHASAPHFGIFSMLLTSLLGTLSAIVIALPIGFFTALFLAKLAPPRIAALIRSTIHLLSGIPSVVYGLIGMLILLPSLRTIFHLPAGDTLLAAVIVLTVMILPSMITVSETALRAVPREYEEGSLALGATELETYFRISTPAASGGLAAGIVLGIGRAIGEAMAIMMVAGNVTNLPSFLKSVRFLTTGIALEMNYASPGSLQREALFSIGLVLFVCILLINILLQWILKGGRKHP
ncbi:MAG: phosphate ABC transporter permease subunit PstC [Oscillospiraceae bacterium]|nr:phosphate ABC transporter permease subunit PstC [Oscillospiraceae bacterium]